MPIAYRFLIHSGNNFELLGALPLRDDDEARSFGAGIIRDLMGSAAMRYATYTMDIVQDERAVANIPFRPPNSN
jgi:hypothetical protein